MVYRAVVLFCRCVIRLFCRHRLEVRGAENVPSRGPALLVPNHSSYLDPPVVAMALRRQVHFMARAGILSVPLLGRLLRRCGVFPVRQGTADRGAIRRAMDLLGSGRLLCIFPEGTRSEDGGLQAVQPGAALVAVRSGAPLIPVAIQGTSAALPRRARWIRPSRISVTFGPPIDLGGDGHAGARAAASTCPEASVVIRHSSRRLESRGPQAATGPRPGARHLGAPPSASGQRSRGARRGRMAGELEEVSRRIGLEIDRLLGGSRAQAA